MKVWKQKVMAGVVSLALLFGMAPAAMAEEIGGNTENDAIGKAVICGFEEKAGHTHDESCICKGGELICGFEESAGHVHDDSCYEKENVLICTSEEEGHEHSSECYESVQNLVCTLEESEGHIHGEECYCQGGEYICGLEESEGHTPVDEINDDDVIDAASDGLEDENRNSLISLLGVEDNIYEVGTEEAYKEAVEEIKANVPAGEEITFVLTDHLSMLGTKYSTTNYAPLELGIEGYSVTYTSKEGEGPYSIGGKTYASTQIAVGDVTLDRVWLNLNQNSGYYQGAVSNFYANGHTVEFTENFHHAIVSLYGGGNNTKVESTHLIINGDITNGQNSENYRVYGGGYYKSGNDGKSAEVTGDVVIDIGENAVTPWIYGGGDNSHVSGDITINMNGGQVSQMSGGGEVRSGGPPSGRFSGTVAGNITLNLNSGNLGSLSSGGSYISDGGMSTSNSSDVQKNNDSYKIYGYLYYGTVGGDINVNFGSAAGGIFTHTSENSALAGSVYSVIQGDVNVTIYDGADLSKHGLHGMGINDIVEGSVNITMEGGEVDSIHGLGEAWTASNGTHMIGRSDDAKVENYYYPKNAMNITINGGSVDTIAWFQMIAKDYGTVKYTDPQIYGNIIITINDGDIGRVYMNNPNNGNPDGIASGSYSKLAYIRGDKGIELHVKGGEFNNVPSIYAHNLSRCYKGQRIYFENTKTVFLYQIVGANSNNNGEQADIIVNNTAPVSIMYYETSGGTQYPGLKDCGDIEILNGTLALAEENTINGDFTIHKDGTLALTAANNDVSENSVLNVKGSVNLSDDSSAAGWLKTVQPVKYNYSSGAYRIYAKAAEVSPSENQVYVRSKTSNEKAQNNEDSSLLDLANSPSQGLYVQYTQDSGATTSSYQHAWRIAKDPDYQEVTWYYEVYYQMSDGTFALWKNSQGGKAGETDTVSISHEQFDGTDLGWEDITEEGNEFLGKHYIFDEGNGNNRLYAAAGEATQANPLKIYYKYAPHTVTYEFSDPIPDGALEVLPEKVDSYYSAEVLVAADPVLQGYTFSGWRVKEPDSVAIANGKITMPNANVVLAGSWTEDAVPEYKVIYDANAGSESSKVTGLPPQEKYKEGNTVTVSAQKPTWQGHTFIEWNTNADGSGTSYHAGDKFEMPNQVVTLFAQWETDAVPAEKVSIRPADVTIYMGGEGYAGTITGSGSEAIDSGFPEPGFVVELPDTLAEKLAQDGKDVTSLKLHYIEDGKTEPTSVWGFEKYGKGDHNIYRIVPAGTTGATKIRMIFTAEDGKSMDSDEFDFQESLYQKLQMKVYGENVIESNVKLVYDGDEYDITTGDGTLTVRGASDAPDDKQYGQVITETEDNESFVKDIFDKESSGVIAPAGTTYTINDSPVEVNAGEEIALLFDDILEIGDDKTNTNLLIQKADQVLDEMEETDLTKDGTRMYEAKYLDLVDRSNGNVWVAASEKITVYWPLPEGTTEETKFELLHFSGLHREMGTSTIPEKIDHCNVEIEDIEVTDTHILFTVDQAGFSPFVLVWEEKDEGTTTPDQPKPGRPSGNKDKVPEQLNGDDHFAYMVGYPDGNVQPNGNITRAETAAIFFRLLQPEIRNENLSDSNVFMDVELGDWHNVSISTMAELGILKGRTETSYVPDAPITRAEFAAICARFDTGNAEGENDFSDIAGHWAEKEIERAASLGWISGYPDGTFRPDQYITRAEAASIINRVLCRMPEKSSDLLQGMNLWPDNMDKEKWYYLPIQEATNSHQYVMKDEMHEKWTEMMEDPDWSRYNTL